MHSCCNLASQQSGSICPGKPVSKTAQASRNHGPVMAIGKSRIAPDRFNQGILTLCQASTIGAKATTHRADQLAHVLAHDQIHGQEWGIFLVEAGVFITVAGTMVAIFYAFTGRGRS